MTQDRRAQQVLLAFSFLFSLLVACAAAAAANALVGVVVRERAIQDRAARLTAASRELKRRVDANLDLDEQMEFLHQLPSLLPEQTRFVRGQSVLQDELSVLRRKAAARLGRSIYVLVDTKVNKLYVKRGLKVLVEADCSVGVGGRLRDKATGRVWDFTTPRGVFSVLWKTEDPIWIKPDWAFVEAKQEVPPPDDPSRMVKGELGRFLLSIGNGYLIHGTPHEEKLGRPASHGCIRLGALPLEEVYKLVPVGTRVYVY
jgi:L,D-transpeptidase YbiS